MIYECYKTDGSRHFIKSDRALELAELQKLVEGFVEFVPGIAPTRGVPATFCVNEQGRLKSLPTNPFFTDLVGNVVVGVSKDGEFLGFDDNAEKVLCKECHEWKPIHADDTRVALHVALQLCQGCHFWHQLEVLKDTPESVRIEGRHYWIGPETSEEQDPPHWRGMNGAKVVIKFHSGREVVTTNLWYQGVIPKHFQSRLSNNAEFKK